MPMFHLTISLEDLGGSGINSLPGGSEAITEGLFDENGFAIFGHEQIILRGVQFWGIPLGYSTDEMISQDIEFTFQGLSFGGSLADPYVIREDYDFPTRIC